MNVNDIDDNAVPTTDDRLALIFERQASLMAKYHSIEASNGLLLTPDVPVDLDDRFGQQRLKDFAWRTTEEVAESLEALSDDAIEHAQEETADALHFFVELCILSGLTAEDFRDPDGINRSDAIEPLDFYFKSHVKRRPDKSVMEFITSLGKAMNCLKNKPWKQTHILTDRSRYISNIKWAFYELVGYAVSLDMTADSLFTLYFKKSEVNKFRQDSNY